MSLTYSENDLYVVDFILPVLTASQSSFAVISRIGFMVPVWGDFYINL